MSAMERITGADWAVWFHHLLSAAIKGGATSADTASALAVGAAMATQWIDFRVLLYAGLTGFVISVVRFLKDNPLPSGTEVSDQPQNTSP